MGVLEKAEDAKDRVERGLPPDVRRYLLQEGLVLSVNSASAASLHTTIQPGHVVVLDRQSLADQVAEEEITASMSAYRTKTTGVDNTIFVSAKVPRHVPRLKVAIDPPTHLDRFGTNASVAIADGSVLVGELPSRAHKQVRQFIELNRDALLDYWEQRIDDDELKARLKRID